VTAAAVPLAFFPGASGRVELLRPISQRLAPGRTTRRGNPGRVPALSRDGLRPAKPSSVHAILCGYPGLAGVAPDPALRTMADLQAHLLARLPPRFDLVTMSMGGVLGLRIALEHPQRLRRLVLMATSGGVDVAALGGADWRDDFRRAQPDAPIWFVDDRTDVTSQLSRIPHPTLLVYGDADPIAPPGVGQVLQRHLPNARLQVLPGATHDLEIEQPETIAALIEAHLS
jgi:pimeloyl-ACP methyl ester carboxylesterase